MRIAVVAPRSPVFAFGGAERAWAGLVGALGDEGHEADLVTLPVDESTFAALADGYRRFATLDLSAFDLVISSKYPAWMAPHPRHVLWMFHPLRGLYDTYHLFRAPLEPGAVEPSTAALVNAVAGPARRDRVDEVLGLVDAAVEALGADHPDLRLPGPTSRLVVRWLDRVALAPGEIVRHAALSRTIAVREGYLPAGIGAHVAHAPSDVASPSVPATAEAPARRHLFTISRLDGPKRLDLVVRAMAHVPGDVPLLIGGTGPEELRLRDLAAGDPRIRFLGRVEDADLGALYAGAIAVPFVPDDEDYGLITLEAMAAGAPVVTVSDSGGPTEVVRHGVDGLIADPTPEALGAALASLVADPEQARAIGEAGRRRAARVTWPTAIATILGPHADASDGAIDGGPATVAPRRRGPDTLRRGTSRPKVVVMTTFRVADRGHGGQLRSFHLYGALARHADVEIVSLTDGGPAGSTELAPGLVETAVPVSDAQRRAAEEMSLAVGIPVSDLAAGSEIEQTPAYLRRLRHATRTADVVIVAEPYLHPALAAAGVDLPFVYDAFNVEADLKADVLPSNRAGAAVLDQVIALEAAVCAGAAAITACSAEDAIALAAAGGRHRSVATVVPNGTDTSAFAPPDPARRRAAGRRWLWRYHDAGRPGPEHCALAVFLGSWHPPNLDAAEAVLRAAPFLPDVLFVLGGRHGDAFAGRRLPDNLLFAGVVPTTAKDALLAAADVAINPMRIGSGTNLKIIEYLAAGVPVASSAVGVRGLEVINGTHLVVGDDIPATVTAVLDDPDAAAARARAGRDLVERHYDWQGLGDRLAEVVARAAG